MARTKAPCGRAYPVDDDVVLSLRSHPSAAWGVEPLGQRCRVVDYRRPVGLCVRGTGLQPAEPLRYHLSETRDPWGINRGCDRQRAIGSRWRCDPRDTVTLRDGLLPGRRLPARPQANVNVVPKGPRDCAR